MKPNLISIYSIKLYVYKKARLGRIPKRHQRVGWNFHDQNLFVYFFKLRSYRQMNRKNSPNITKKLKEKNLCFGVTITYSENVRCDKYICFLFYLKTSPKIHWQLLTLQDFYPTVKTIIQNTIYLIFSLFESLTETHEHKFNLHFVGIKS